MREIALIAPIVILCVGGAVTLGLGRVVRARLLGLSSTAFAAISLLLLLWNIPTIQHSPVDLQLLTWIPLKDFGVRLSYRLDALSYLFALVGGFVSLCLLAATAFGRSEEEARTYKYAHPMILVAMAGYLSLVLSTDLLFLFFSWEIVMLSAFFLVALGRQRAGSRLAARKIFVATHVLGYGPLAAFLLLGATNGGVFVYTGLSASTLTMWPFLLLLAGVVVRSAQFPFHSWVTSSAEAPLPASAIFYAGPILLPGAYLLFRTYGLVVGAAPLPWHKVLLVIGAASLIAGAVEALRERNLSRMLAFVGASQMGYVFMGIGIGTPVALAGALFQVINLSLLLGSLALVVDALHRRAGTLDVADLGGLGRAMPWHASFFFLAAGALGGLPLLSGFVSQWLIYTGAVESGQPLFAVVGVVGSLISLVCLIKVASGLFLGRERGLPNPRGGDDRGELAILGLLTAIAVVIGLLPQIPIHYLIRPAVRTVVNFPLASLNTSVLGLASAGTAWLSVLVLALLAVCVVVGWLIQRRPQPGSSPALAFLGGERWESPTGDENVGMSSADFSVALERMLHNFYPVVEPDRIFLWAESFLTGIGQFLQAIVTIIEGRYYVPAAVVLTLIAVLVMIH